MKKLIKTVTIALLALVLLFFGITLVLLASKGATCGGIGDVWADLGNIMSLDTGRGEIFWAYLSSNTMDYPLMELRSLGVKPTTKTAYRVKTESGWDAGFIAMTEKIEYRDNPAHLDIRRETVIYDLAGKVETDEKGKLTGYSSTLTVTENVYDNGKSESSVKEYLSDPEKAFS